MHRDVKPANILVREDGVVKLTDFGIARAMDAIGHTRVGEMLGTPNYISPEQAVGEQATGASDLYALGVVAHEMLTGTRPFDRGTPIATAMSHVNEAPPPLGDDVPVDLRAVVASLLEKDPAKRPANAHDVAALLGVASAELTGLDLDRGRRRAQWLHGDAADADHPAEGGAAGRRAHPRGRADRRRAARGPAGLSDLVDVVPSAAGGVVQQRGQRGRPGEHRPVAGVEVDQLERVRRRELRHVAVVDPLLCLGRG